MSAKGLSLATPLPKVAGLILAAGMGTRMGRAKQLLPVPVGLQAASLSSRTEPGEKVAWIPLIRRILLQTIPSKLEHAVVVLGHQAQEVQQSIADLLQLNKVSVVHNREYGKGLSSSIRAGLEHISTKFDHVMILLADMVHIDCPLIDSFLHAYLKSGAPLGAVIIEGKRSHPVIFRSDLFHELSSLEGDMGGRELFSKYRSLAFFWEAPPDVRELDIDTPGDYEQLIEPFHKHS